MAGTLTDEQLLQALTGATNAAPKKVVIPPTAPVGPTDDELLQALKPAAVKPKPTPKVVVPTSDPVGTSLRSPQLEVPEGERTTTKAPPRGKAYVRAAPPVTADAYNSQKTTTRDVQVSEFTGLPSGKVTERTHYKPAVAPVNTGHPSDQMHTETERERKLTDRILSERKAAEDAKFVPATVPYSPGVGAAGIMLPGRVRKNPTVGTFIQDSARAAANPQIVDAVLSAAPATKHVLDTNDPRPGALEAAMIADYSILKGAGLAGEMAEGAFALTGAGKAWLAHLAEEAGPRGAFLMRNFNPARIAGEAAGGAGGQVALNKATGRPTGEGVAAAALLQPLIHTTTGILRDGLHGVPNVAERPLGKLPPRPKVSVPETVLTDQELQAALTPRKVLKVTSRQKVGTEPVAAEPVVAPQAVAPVQDTPLSVSAPEPVATVPTPAPKVGKRVAVTVKPKPQAAAVPAEATPKTVTVSETPAVAPGTKPQGQSIQNAATDALRDSAGLPARERPTPQKVEEWAAEAERRGVKEQASTIAREVLDGKKAQLDPVESLGIAARLDELDARRKTLTERASSPDKGPHTVEAVADLGEVLDEIETLVDATNQAGTAWGRAGVARRAYANSRYDYTGMLATVKKNLGRELTDAERQQLTELTTKHESAIQERDTYKARAAELETENAKQSEALRAQMHVDDVATTAKTRKPKTPELAEAREARILAARADATKRLQEKLKNARKLAGQDIGPGVPRSGKPGMRSGAIINPASVVKAASRYADVVPEVLEIVDTYVQQGIVKAEDVAAKVAGHFRENGHEMTDAEALAIMAGKVKPAEVQQRAQSQLAKTKAEARQVFTDAAATARAEAVAARQAERAAETASRQAAAATESAAKKAAREEARLQARAFRQAAEEKARAATQAKRAFEKDLAERQRAYLKGEKAKTSAGSKEYQDWWKNSVGGEKAKLLEQLDSYGSKLAEAREGRFPTARAKAGSPTDPENYRLDLQVEKARRELDILRRDAKAKGDYAKLSTGQKAIKGAVGAARVLSGSQLSGDVGQVMRQGLFSWSRPLKALKGVRNGVRAALSEDALVAMQAASRDKMIDGRSAYTERLRAGLKKTDGVLNEEEGMVVVRALKKFPGLKPLVEGSKRAKTIIETPDRFQSAFINTVRDEFFDEGIRRGYTPDELKLRAQFLNNVTGRGNLKSVPESLQAIFTSPRFEWSRWATLYEPFKNTGVLAKDLATGKGLNRAARDNIQDMAVTLGGIVSLYKAAELAGYKADWDPDSGTFLNLVREDKRGLDRSLTTGAVEFVGGGTNRYGGKEVVDMTAGLSPRIKSILRMVRAYQRPEFGKNLGTETSKAVGRAVSPGLKTPISQSSIALQRQRYNKALDPVSGFKSDEEREGWITLAPLIAQAMKEAYK